MLQNMSMTEAFCENEISLFFLLSRSNGTGSIAGLVVGWLLGRAYQVKLVCIMTLMWNISRDEQSF